jgi:poly(A) polymerase
MRFADVEKMRDSTLKRFLRLPRFEEHMELHRMDCLSSHGDLSLYNFVRDRLRNTPEEEIRPKLLLKGEDLIALGYRPGPQFKEILAAVEDAQLEGSLHDWDEAVSLVLSNFPQLN